MRRLFWMGVGALGAAWVTRRARQAVARLPQTVTSTVTAQATQARTRVSTVARDAVAAFRSARTEREAELVEALLVEPEGGTERRPRSDRASAATRAVPGTSTVDPWDDDPWGPADDEADL